MHDKNLDQLVLQLENYIECWKQVNYFVGLARAKKFTQEDELQFLDVKSVIIQELETILSKIDCTSPSRDEIHNLIMSIPTIRFLSESSENALRGVETQWHRIFLAWQSNLGQLKVKQRELESQSFFSTFFGKKKK